MRKKCSSDRKKLLKFEAEEVFALPVFRKIRFMEKLTGEAEA